MTCSKTATTLLKALSGPVVNDRPPCSVVANRKRLGEDGDRPASGDPQPKVKVFADGKRFVKQAHFIEAFPAHDGRWGEDAAAVEEIGRILCRPRVFRRARNATRQEARCHWWNSPSKPVQC